MLNESQVVVIGGRYVTVDIKRREAARFALNIADIQEVVKTALGGMRVGMTVEGLERYPINVRYPRDVRDSLEKLRNLPVVTPAGARIPLAEVDLYRYRRTGSGFLCSGCSAGGY